MTIRDLDDVLDDEFTDDELRSYGQPSEPAWRSPRVWDGEMTLAQRRPEVLDADAQAAWWHDLKSWATWAIDTFRISRLVPECWPQHPALVEEMMSLWLVWQQAWLPADDATAPAMFLQQLDLALSRIDRLWKVPCDAGNHKSFAPSLAGAEGTPELHRWWGNDNYLEVRQ